jgi:hypothetical protein
VQHEEEPARRRVGVDENEPLVEGELAADVEQFRDEILVYRGLA